MASEDANTSQVDVPIPRYRIDLSLPPAERYVKLAADFTPQMKNITPLFDTVLEELVPWSFPRRIAKFFALRLLRRVYSEEETEELRGIVKTCGVDMYLLVALNVLLDSLLGCTSGGVLARVPVKKSSARAQQDESLPDENQRMLHFRTLDWGMPELRNILVVLEFVRSQSDEPDRVIGTSITYAGFTGMLTGVRENLSMSLNFRPSHDCATLSLRIHQLMVLLGKRPSVSSILRNTFLSPGRDELSIDGVAETVMKARATPCYVTFCSGQKTIVIQKDLFHGVSKSATDFIVQTNHDDKSLDPTGGAPTKKDKQALMGIGMNEVIKDSEERKDCIQKKWETFASRRQQRENASPVVSEQTLKRWVDVFPIMNEETHFGCILDPGTGSIRWLVRGDEDAQEAASETVQ